MRKWNRIILSLIVSAILLTSCGTSQDNLKDTQKITEESNTMDFTSVKIGAFTSSNKDDGGWNQVQYAGLTKMLENLGLSDEQFVFIEDVAEEGNSGVATVVQQMVEDGCNIIIGVASGYKDAMGSVAKEYPDIQFVQFNGYTSKNEVGYSIRHYQGMFLCGYICSLVSGTDELGYVTGYPEASNILALNAFAQGAKYGNPLATVQVSWTNSWYDPAAEKECANSLITKGITCIGMSAASSPAIPQACQEAGVYCTGYHLDMKKYAPEAVMTSFMWNWAPIFEDIVTRFVQGQGIPFQENYFWGADKGCAAIADINLGIVPQEIADKVYKAQEMIISGEIDVFSGELRDNQGNVVVPKGETMSDGQMMDMGFLLDNVIGTLP